MKKVMFESAAAVCLMGALFAGCGRPVADAGDGGYSEISFEREETAEWVPVSSDLEIGVPMSMVADSTMVYFLSVAGGKVLHGFSLEDGNKTRAFGTMGQGPTEFISPLSCQIVDSTIVCYDSGDVSLKTLAKDGTFLQKYPLPGEQVVNEAFYVAPSTWLGIGANRKLMLYSNNDELALFDVLPSGYDNIKDWFDLQYHACYVDRHLFYATLLGGFLESFSIDGDSITLVNRLHLPGCEVKYNKSTGRIDYSAINYGFTAVCAANGYCLGAFSASNNPDANSKIGIWNYNLDPIVCLNTDKFVVAITVVGNKLYALTHNPETGFCLDYLLIDKYTNALAR